MHRRSRQHSAKLQQTIHPSTQDDRNSQPGRQERRRSWAAARPQSPRARGSLDPNPGHRDRIAGAFALTSTLRGGLLARGLIRPVFGLMQSRIGAWLRQFTRRSHWNPPKHLRWPSGVDVRRWCASGQPISARLNGCIAAAAGLPPGSHLRRIGLRRAQNPWTRCGAAITCWQEFAEKSSIFNSPCRINSCSLRDQGLNTHRRPTG